MNFSSNSSAVPASRLSRLQLGHHGQARTGLPLSATSFDYRNNNVFNNANKSLHYSSSTGDKPTNSANNFSVKFSPRVPEIQMINKFYGLIPKKFVISERTKPPPTPVLRQKISIRPKTSKHSASSPQRSTFFENGDGPRLRRHSSVDETGRREENDLDVPLLTRRISFERSPSKPLSKADRSVNSDKNSSSGLSALLNQRVIRIDLNHMRWEEETAGDYEHDLPQSTATKELENVPPPKSGILRKTISFDESVLKGQGNESSGDETGSGLCKGHLLQVKERPTTARPSLVNYPVVRASDSSLSSWTAGKTTAERRAKLQRSFSIHPSFAETVVTDPWASGEVEPGTYPDSMTRTGRRSFHVEPPPEVDTLVSKGTTKEVLKPLTRQQRSLEASQNSSGRKLVVAEKVQPAQPPPPQPQVVHQKPVSLSVALPAPVLLPASERRKLFKKSVSLPAPEPESKTPVKSTTGAARPSLGRQNSAAVTKSEVHRLSSNSNHVGKGKVGGGVSRVPMLKKTLIELKRLRPKTAPSNQSQSSRKAGSESGHQDEHTRRRRQPLKVKSDVSVSARLLQEDSESSSSGVGPQTTVKTPSKQVTIMESKSQKVKKAHSKAEVVVATVEPPPPPRPASPPPTAPIPRRSFSLDEGSLLTYSTDAAQRADSMENSMQNSKKREECLKIYERMKEGGCAVRLQTIFRGLMTPSEYRMFMAAAEKAAAAAASLAEAEAGTTGDQKEAAESSARPPALEALEHHTGSPVTVLAP